MATTVRQVISAFRSHFPRAPPSNNNFSAAATLTAGVRTTATNVLATAEVGEPAHYSGGTSPNVAAKSLWWRWTAAATGFVSLTTAGSNFDTVLAVYTGSSLSALSRVAENDEATTNDSSSGVFFRAVAGAFITSPLMATWAPLVHLSSTLRRRAPPASFTPRILKHSPRVRANWSGRSNGLRCTRPPPVALRAFSPRESPVKVAAAT